MGDRLDDLEARISALEKVASDAIGDAANCIRRVMAAMSDRLDALEEKERGRS